jgi:hypothetical protein
VKRFDRGYEGLMKRALLAIAAVLVFSGATAGRAGPATSDTGGVAPGAAAPLPTFDSVNPTGGGAAAGNAGPGPSFGSQNAPDSGFGAPQSLPDADDPSLLPTDSGDKK